MATVAAIQRRRTIHHAIEAQSVSHGSNWSSSLSLSLCSVLEQDFTIEEEENPPRFRSQLTGRATQPIRVAQQVRVETVRISWPTRGDGVSIRWPMFFVFEFLRAARSFAAKTFIPRPGWIARLTPVFGFRDRRGASFFVKKVAISPGSDVKWKIDRGKLGWREFARTFSINFVNICGPLNENIS